jgi:hypothetical protein
MRQLGFWQIVVGVTFSLWGTGPLTTTYSVNKSGKLGQMRFGRGLFWKGNAWLSFGRKIGG